MPASDVTIQANYDATEYTLEISHDGLCEVHDDHFISKLDNDEIHYVPALEANEDLDDLNIGDEVTLTAPEIAGYRFNGWEVKDANNNTINCTPVQGNNVSIRFEMPANHVTAMAKYVDIDYVVAANVNIEGAGSVTGVGTFHYGNVATLEAINTTCYHFTQWSDGITDNPRTIIVDKDSTLTAMFERNDTLQGIDTIVAFYSYTWIDGRSDKRRVGTARRIG